MEVKRRVAGEVVQERQRRHVRLTCAHGATNLSLRQRNPVGVLPTSRRVRRPFADAAAAAVRHPKLKVSTPAHTKHPGWTLIWYPLGAYLLLLRLVEMDGPWRGEVPGGIRFLETYGPRRYAVLQPEETRDSQSLLRI